MRHDDSFWRQLEEENCEHVEEAFLQLDEEQKNAMTHYMPAIPIPDAIDQAGRQLTSDEMGMLVFYAAQYPHKHKEPDFYDTTFVHRERAQIIWTMAKEELQEYMDMYCKYQLLGQLKARMGMTREAAAFQKQVDSLNSADAQKKGPQKPRYGKDKYLHI